MDTNDEIRRRRLEQLCEQSGGVRAVAEKAEMNWQSLDQIIKGVLLPAKADGTRSPRALGDQAARMLEAAYNLQPGWLDWPFEHVDFNEWAKLDEGQRNFVQGMLQAAIEKAQSKTSPIMEAVNRKPVPDSKVEKAFKRPPAAPAPRAREPAAPKRP